MTKLVSRCPLCDGITFMAVYDTPEEILSAQSSLKKLIKVGRSVEFLIHEATDPQPQWCTCE